MEEVFRLKSILGIYEAASGQRVNFQKTSVMFSPNSSTDLKTYILGFLNIREEGGHGKYLGLPSVIGRAKTEVFKGVVEKVRKKLQLWKLKRFSMGGREVLIKAVIQAIPTFTMSIFKLPESTISEINGLAARFLWGGDDAHRPLFWKSWKTVCAPKAFGGLGFRDLCCFNKALLGKQFWRLLTIPTSLMSRVVLDKYCKTESLWTVSLRRRPSEFWRSVLWCRDLMKAGAMVRPGHGQDVKKISDPWLPHTPSHLPITPPSHALSHSTVADLLTVEGGWDFNRIQEILWPVDGWQIRGIPRPRIQSSARWFWEPNKHGKFTVRSAYILATNPVSTQGHTSNSTPIVWWNWFWNLLAPPKLKLFGWRLWGNLLPTAVNLKKHGVKMLDRCRVCGLERESELHVFLKCPMAKSIWSASDVRLRCTNLSANDGHGLIFLASATLSADDFILWLGICYNIWWERNKLLFGGSVRQAGLIAFQSKEWLDGYELTNNLIHPPRLQLTRQQIQARWSPPPIGHLKLNTDASVRDHGMGVGAVIRNWGGESVAGCMLYLEGPFSPEGAELIALNHGLKLCNSLYLHVSEIEVDSISVVSACKNKEFLGCYGEIVEDVDAELSLLGSVALSWVKRAANGVAHDLAKCAVEDRLSVYWNGVGPPIVSNFVLNDIF